MTAAAILTAQHILSVGADRESDVCVAGVLRGLGDILHRHPTAAAMLLRNRERMRLDGRDHAAEVCARAAAVLS